MATFKLTISDPETGKTVQKEVKDEEAESFIGKKIREQISGDVFGLAGYNFEITGGSDYCGFPMRKDITGSIRKRILLVSGIGARKKGKGIKQRKTVCGNTIYARTAQINLKTLAKGRTNIFEGVKESKKPKKKEEKAEPKKEEKPKTEAKLKEEKPEEKK